MSPLLWTPPTPGDCVHGEPAADCPVCHPHHSWIDRHGLVLFVLLVAALALVGRGSWARDLAFDDAVHRAHIARTTR